MTKYRVKLSKPHGPHEAGSVIEVSEHTLQTFRDRMHPVESGASSSEAKASVFGSPQAEKLAKENNVTAEQLQAWRKPSGETGYTKPDVQAFLDERTAAQEAERQAAAVAEEERQAAIFAAYAEQNGKAVEDLTEEERATALAEFDAAPAEE